MSVTGVLVAGGRPRFFVVSVVTGVEGMLGADSGTETTGADYKIHISYTEST